MRQIFLSHASADGGEARRLRNLILSKHPTDQVFLSSEQVAGPVGGTEWRAWIRNSIYNSDLVIFLDSNSARSAWCSAEVGAARLLGKHLLPLRIDAAIDPHPLLSDLQTSPLGQPPERLLGLIDNLVAPTSETIAMDGRLLPYPGLNPLDQTQAPLLFGRAAEIRRILQDLDPDGQARVITLTGPSGSGKSSLVLAGIIPRLISAYWTVGPPTQPNELATDALPELPSTRPAAVVIDQAEELLSLTPGDQARISSWIRDAIEAGVYVVVAVRTEFRSGLGALIPKPIDHYIAYMERAELYEIIRGPARFVNLHLPEDLVQRLVDETGSGEALPLLSLTLHELWKQRNVETNELQVATLDQLGGVRGVLQGLADQALHVASEGDPAEVENVLALLSRLAVPDQVPVSRSPIRLATLGDNERRYLEHFVAAGLVAFRTSYSLRDRVDTGVTPTGNHLVDVTHEKLFTWQPLETAISERRAINTERRSIERTAQEWDRGGRVDQSLYLAGDRLRFATNHDLGSTDPVLQEFIRRSSRQDRDRRIRRVFTGLLAVAAVLIATLGFLALQQRNAAREAEDEAQQAASEAKAAEQTARDAETVTRSLRMAAEAASAPDSLGDFALLAAVAAYRTSPNADTEAALLNALSEPSGPLRYFSDDRADWSKLRLLDSDYGLVPTDDGRIHQVDLVAGTLVEVGEGTDIGNVLIQETNRIPNSLTIWFRGLHGDGGWAIGTWDFGAKTGAVYRHPEEIRVVAGSVDSLAFGDSLGVVTVVDRQSGIQAAVDSHEAPITGIDLSRSGKHLAASSSTGVRLYTQRENGFGDPQDLLSVTPGQRTTELVRFRRDSVTDDPDIPVQLLGAGSDPAVRRWSIQSDDSVVADVLGSHPGPVTEVAVAPDDPLLITAGLDGNLQRWDLAAGTAIGDELDAHTSQITGLAAVNTRLVVATASDRAILWDFGPTRIVSRDEAMSADWQGQAISTVVEGDGPLAVVTTDGRVLAEGVSALSGPDGTWRAWWIETAGNWTTLVYEQRSLARAYDGVTVWLSDGDQLSEVLTGAAAVDVKGCLAAVAHRQTVEIVDVGGCAIEIPPPTSLEEDPLAVAWSDATDEIAVAVRSGRIDIIDAATGAITETLTASEPTTITALEWIHDETIVVGHDIGGSTELIERSDGGSTLLAGHDDAVRWITAAADGRRIYLGGEDGRITQHDTTGRPGRLLHTATSESRSTENDKNAAVRALRLDGDQGILYTVQGSKVVAWELDPERLVAMACERAGRNLAEAERQRLGVSGPPACNFG